MSDFRDPFETTSWPLVPGRTVLVNIDLQNDFLHAGRVVREERHRHLAHAAGHRAGRSSSSPPAASTAFPSSGHGTARTASRTAGRSWSSAPSCATAACARAHGGTRSSPTLQPQAEDRFVEKNRLSAFFQTQPRARPARSRRRDGPDRRRADEPVRRRNLQGRALPRLQADRGRGGDRHDAAAPPRAGDRDDAASAGAR